MNAGASIVMSGNYSSWSSAREETVSRGVPAGSYRDRSVRTTEARIVWQCTRGAGFHHACVEQSSGLGSLNPALSTTNKQLAAAVVGGHLAGVTL